MGYAKGINGSLMHHAAFFSRHLYTPHMVQKNALAQLTEIIEAEDPDLCCLVEIDGGSLHVGYLDQLGALKNQNYEFHDISDKYGPQNILAQMPFHKGKSNAFMAKQSMEFQRHYLADGSKKLLYSLNLPGDIVLFFAHFSLKRKVRLRQFHELKRHLSEHAKVIVLGDFNIMHGFSELDPLLMDGNLQLLNRHNEPTFRFHQRNHVLDLCLCSKDLAERMRLKVIPQPFSDHAALLVEVDL
jgi:endonuclease/exonuclease/phosphatase family metal-dependent hydrolase